MNNQIGAIAKTSFAILTLFVLLSGCVSIGSDKILHFSAAGLISILATCMVNEEVAIVTGAAAGLGAGLVKEAYDASRGGSGFSGEDLLADGIGAGVGTTLGYQLCHAQGGN